MCIVVEKALTYKSRIRQIGDGNKFILSDNEVFATACGVIIAPRYLFTDNITFVNNTFVDVRASHIHDIGCAYHKVIVSNLTEKDLMDMGLLYLNEKATERERKFLSALKEKGKYKGDPNVYVWVCDDIPSEYIETIDVSFAENNRLFKQMLIATGVPHQKADIMGGAVYLNAGWVFKKKYDLPPTERIFKDLLIT